MRVGGWVGGSEGAREWVVEWVGWWVGRRAVAGVSRDCFPAIVGSPCCQLALTLVLVSVCVTGVYPLAGLVLLGRSS